MHRILQANKRLIEPLKARLSHGIKFNYSGQVDPSPQSEPSINVPKELYSVQNYMKIRELQSMSYLNLLEEIKKYPNKPKARSKNVLLQFLIEKIPKKNEAESDVNEYNNNELRSNSRESKEFKNDLKAGLFIDHTIQVSDHTFP